ncbi:MAG: serine/threonine protein kinase [Planctomycetes bacterium]|nr:serine/threonine protein kinase [Planctomycetota bacterium]
MVHPPALESNADRDELLARLLAELMEQFRQGRRPDVEALAGRHPHLAHELRELWGAAVLAEELSRPVPGLAVPRPLPTPSPAGESRPSEATWPRCFGDYDLLEELGRGGMGVVYKARQRSLDRVVAIKMILRGELASPADLARFRAEAESAARLEHPHIVSVYEVGDCDGQAYFSMQYVEGPTLAARLAKGPLPPREAASILVPICRAVQHAHQHGLLHRDLKPSNVLLDPEGRPLVTDFGLAKRVTGGDSLTQSGAILGTPSYMAPEQAAGSRGVLSPATDVYSLGTILYEMLTGRPPFKAASAVDTIMLVLEQEPVPPRLWNPRVDRDLEMICLKCLQKPADLRYPGAGQLADDLEKFLQGEPIASSLGYLISRVLRETHHAAVLENWGLLWMWHSLVLLVLCSVTNWMHLEGVNTPWPYLALWGLGLHVWALIFMAIRRWGGPVTFVERQIGHVWAASTIGSISMFVVERMLRLEPLTLSPVLAVLAGMVFLIKAGTLSGSFYISSAISFLTAIPMALYPKYGVFLFGVVSALCFFIPGLKYYRQRVRSGHPAR